MFCTQCRNEVEPQARFCSKCGQEVSAAAPVQQTGKAPHDMDMHVNILGWLLIGSGILTGIGGMIVLFAGQFVFRHLPIHIAREIPVGVPPLIAWMTSVVGLGILALAAATTAAGVGLLQYRQWARVFAIIVAVFMLFHFPIGTIIAVYAFWVLFSEDGQRYYKTRAASTMTASGT